MSHVIFFNSFIIIYFYRPPPEKYWSYDPHRSRDSVSPVCGIFSLFNILIFKLMLIFRFIDLSQGILSHSRLLFVFDWNSASGRKSAQLTPNENRKLSSSLSPVYSC